MANLSLYATPQVDYNGGSRIYTTIPRREPGDKPHHEYFECALSPAMYHHIQNTLNFPQAFPLPLKLQLIPGVLEEKLNAVELMLVEGKEQGIVARRDISTSMFLFAKRPLLAASPDFLIPFCGTPFPGLPPSDPHEEEYMRNLDGQHRTLERAASRVLSKNQQASMALANAFPCDTQVNGIAETNVCNLEEDTGELHGLFTMRVLNVSNHTCRW